MRARACALAALAAFGCFSSGVPFAELPESPIAVVYRSPEDSRRHAELLLAERDAQSPQAEPAQPMPPPGEEGVARVRDIKSYMKTVLTGVPGSPAQTRYPGRLGFLQPRRAVIENFAGASGEAVPHAWSADRSRLLFTTIVDRFAQVFELDVASGEVRPITHGPDAHPAACYGPDGSVVLMSARVVNDQVQSQIEILEHGSATPRALTPGPRDYAPTCSADGRWLAWMTAPKRGVEWVMSREIAGEAEARRLGPGREPRFCGPGDWIVYSAPIQRGSKLWRVRADGTGRSPIGRGVLDESGPACSPDGGKVVYVVIEDFRETLYVRRFDGSGDRILYADSDASHPVW